MIMRDTFKLELRRRHVRAIEHLGPAHCTRHDRRTLRTQIRQTDPCSMLGRPPTISATCVSREKSSPAKRYPSTTNSSFGVSCAKRSITVRAPNSGDAAVHTPPIAVEIGRAHV